jgi:hypothetical protein
MVLGGWFWKEQRCWRLVLQRVWRKLLLLLMLRLPLSLYCPFPALHLVAFASRQPRLRLHAVDRLPLV